MNKILFVNTLHSSFDDRTFYHQANALSQKNVEVHIFSTLETKYETINNISICSEKICDSSFFNQLKFIGRIVENNLPDIVICDSPLGVLASFLSKNKCTIIYDVTEWIPSKKNLKNSTLLLMPIKFIGLLLFNVTAGFLTNKFIFGEYYKAVPFKLFFWKKSIISSYFPDLKYIPVSESRDISNKIRLNYSGWFNVEKGFDRVLEITRILADSIPALDIELQLTGNYSNDFDKRKFESIISLLPENVAVLKTDFKDFNVFCSGLQEADVFLDFRKNDFENTHCLPIKLFYYLASGKPVIYSGLKAIKKELNLNEIGCFFENNDYSTIVKTIENYIEIPGLYKSHCDVARKLSIEKYNWVRIMPEFVNFVLPNSKKIN